MKTKLESEKAHKFLQELHDLKKISLVHPHSTTPLLFLHVNHYQLQENAYQEMHHVFDEHYSSKCKDQMKAITLFHSLSLTRTWQSQ
jgi:hypothetical protein